MNTAKRLSLLFMLVWYLGVYEGHLALFKENTDKPCHIFPYCVSVYPSADQKALREGIPAETDKELLELLQEYLS